MLSLPPRRSADNLMTKSNVREEACPGQKEVPMWTTCEETTSFKDCRGMFWPCGQRADVLRSFPRNAVGTQQMKVMTLIDLNECNVQLDNTVHALVSGRLVEVHTTVTSSTRGTASAGSTADIEELGSRWSELK